MRTPNAKLPHDQLWPRSGDWPAPMPGESVDLALVGVPTSRTSLSPSRAHETPAAVRQALRRYSSHLVDPAASGRRGAERELVLDEVLRIVDAGDVPGPDTEPGEAHAAESIARLAGRAQLVVALGGDNAATVPAALGVAAGAGGVRSTGLITLDAHHDLRDGRTNGAPVRRLIEAGFDPRRIVQIGIADFANSRAYRERARQWGITVIHRDELHERPIAEVVAEALGVAGSGGGPIHVDIDVDVCDRAVAPACPASMPGGLQAHELRRFVRRLAADTRVRGIDFTEVDAAADAPDARTVRLVALCVLEAAAGLALRKGLEEGTG